MDMRISFQLSRDEVKRAQKAGVPPFINGALWCSGISVVSYCVALALNIHRGAMTIGLDALAILAWSSFFAINASRRVKKLAREGSIRLTNEDIVGSLDGRDVRIPWRLVASVQDTGDFIVFLPRHSVRSIAVPKANIDDVAALWTFLYSKLVARRSLIRTFPPQTTILNTAYRAN